MWTNPAGERAETEAGPATRIAAGLQAVGESRRSSKVAQQRIRPRKWRHGLRRDLGPLLSRGAMAAKRRASRKERGQER